MGEAKRRARATPFARTTVSQVLRRINEAAADLRVAPMNGANAIDLSPGDFDRLCVRTEVSPLDGRTLSGLRVVRDVRLIDGVFVGRLAGKTVWSNNPKLQEAIDAGLDLTLPTPDPSYARS